MKEKTKIRHRLKDNAYCSETLDKESWGDRDYHMTCNKCGFVKIIDTEMFLKWRYSDEVVENKVEGGDKKKILSDRQKD